MLGANLFAWNSTGTSEEFDGLSRISMTHLLHHVGTTTLDPMSLSTIPPPNDSRPAFLFQCGDSNLWAITLDQTGRNLPEDECEDGWRLLQEFALGVQEPVPATVNPENVITGIDARGFYVWHDMSVSVTKTRR
jgi:hypothetical protein